MSIIKQGSSLTWEIGTLSSKKSSPEFRFQNSVWHLEIIPVCTKEDYGKRNDEDYLYLNLVKESRGKTPVRPFRITTSANTSGKCGIGMVSVNYLPDDSKVRIWEACFSQLRKCSFPNALKFVLIFEIEGDAELDGKGEEKVTLDSDLPSLSSDLGNLLKSGEASDVQLKTSVGKRPAHRSILAARSQVFSAMFRNDMDESTSGLVDIRDVDGEVMDLFLQYVYTGKIQDSVDGGALPELYATGDKYAVHSLKKLCRDRMTTNVSEDNYQELLAFADAHSDEKLKEKIIKSIVENPEWLNCEKWLEVSKQHLALGKDVYQKFYEESYLNKKT